MLKQNSKSEKKTNKSADKNYSRFKKRRIIQRGNHSFGKTTKENPKKKIKAKSDGVVTPKERAKLHAEQNRASRTIYRKKHNLRTK